MEWYIPNHNNIWNGIDPDRTDLIHYFSWDKYLAFIRTPFAAI